MPTREPAKARILRATSNLISEEGIAALSNRRIAEKASVSLGSLTYHFPQQEGLLRECLEAHVHEKVEWIEAAARELRERRLGAAELGSEIERLAVAAADRAELITELEVHLHATRHPALQETSRSCFAAYEDFAAAALEALGIPDPQRHAPHVVALMVGAGLLQLSTGDRSGGGLGEALMTIALGAAAVARAPGKEIG